MGRLMSTIFGAFAQALPDRLQGGPGSGGPLLNVRTTDNRTGRSVMANISPITAGAGASAAGDGSDGCGANQAFFKNTPAEINEADVPIRILEYGLAPDSAGAGRHRGGLSTTMLFQQGAPHRLGIRNHGKDPGPAVPLEAFRHVAPQLQRFLRPSRVVQRRRPVHQRVAIRFCRLRRTVHLEAPDRFFPQRERFRFPLQRGQHVVSVGETARHHLPKDQRFAWRVTLHDPVKRRQRLLQPARLEERSADVRKRRGDLFDYSERVAPSKQS